MFKENWQQLSRIQQPSCRWIYAGVTLVGLGAGVMLVTTPAFADTRETTISDGTPQTENVAVTPAARSTTPADVSQSGQSETSTGTASIRKGAGTSDETATPGNPAKPVTRDSESTSAPTPGTTTKAPAPTDTPTRTMVTSKPTVSDKRTTMAIKPAFRTARYLLSRGAAQPTGQGEPSTEDSANTTPDTTPASDVPTAPATAVAVTTPTTAETRSALAYTLNAGKDGYVVTGFANRTHGTRIAIPDTYLNLPVTEVAADAFNGAGLTDVTLGQNLQVIWHHAFANNQLKTIKFTNGIWSVGAGAFANNDLVTVDLGHLQQINTGAFQSNQIQRLVLPDSVTSLADDAFENNTIQSLTLSQNVVSIGTAAFANNQIQGHLVLPETLTALGDQAFANNQLTGVTLDAGLSLLNTGVFANNQLTGTLTIPATITSIGDDAFDRNQLTGLQLDDSVTSIGTAAFAHNLLAGSLNLPASLTHLGDQAFWDNRLRNVTLNDKLTEIGPQTFADNRLTGTLKLPDTILNVGTAAFADNQLTGLTGGTKLNTIEQYAFYGNKLTGTLRLSDQLTSIGESAFAGGNQLTRLELGTAPLSTIEANAFANNNLTGVLHFPDTLTNVGADAFVNNQLTGLTFGTGLVTVNDEAFEHNQLSGTLKLGDNVHDVGKYAFAYNQLADLEMGSNMNSLENYSFAYNSLQKINASGQIGTIGDYAFAGQTLLKAGTAKAVVTNQAGWMTTVVSGVKQAIRDELGMKNLDIAGLTFIFTDNQDKLVYDVGTDTLVLPRVPDKADSNEVPDWMQSGHVVLSLTTKSVDTGRYGVENLMLGLDRWVTADVAIPSNLKDEGLGDLVSYYHADKVPEQTAEIGGPQISVKVPSIPDYVADKATIQAIANVDGTISPLESVIYTNKTNGSGKENEPATGNQPSTPGDTGKPTGPVTPVNPGNTDDGGDSAVTPVIPVVTPTTGGDEASPYPPDFDSGKSQTKKGSDAHQTGIVSPKLAIEGPNWQLKRVVPQRLTTTGIRQRVTTRTTVAKPEDWVNSQFGVGRFARTEQQAAADRQATNPARPSASAIKQQTLPQTNEQPTGWQWLGTIFLAGLSWLGLAHKRNHN